MAKSVILLPSRGRSHRIDECLDSLLEHSTVSDIIVCLDEDDHHNYPKRDGVIYDVGPVPKRIGLNEKLNRMLPKVLGTYDYVLWAADDTVAVTHGWDELLVEAIKDVPLGIAYPNDLLQGKRLPSNGTCFDSKILNVLGYFAPPTLFHLYMDDFWKLLGEELGTLRYCEDVILEHNHYVNKKAPKDATYASINSREMYVADNQSYEIYKNHGLADDVKKLNESLND
jgi:hypothetical protein